MDRAISLPARQDYLGCHPPLWSAAAPTRKPASTGRSAGAFIGRPTPTIRHGADASAAGPSSASHPAAAVSDARRATTAPERKPLIVGMGRSFAQGPESATAAVTWCDGRDSFTVGFSSFARASSGPASGSQPTVVVFGRLARVGEESVGYGRLANAAVEPAAGIGVRPSLRWSQDRIRSGTSFTATRLLIIAASTGRASSAYGPV